MSFADDFDHYIPPDDWGGDGGSYGKYGSYPSKYTGNKRNSSYISQSSGNYITSKDFIKVCKETNKAFLVKFKEGNAWIPKSRISMIDLVKSKILIPVWLSQRLSYVDYE